MSDPRTDPDGPTDTGHQRDRSGGLEQGLLISTRHKAQSFGLRTATATRFSFRSSTSLDGCSFENAVHVVFTRHVLELIRLIRLLSEDVGYHGNWAVAVGADRLRDRRRWNQPSIFASNHRYSADTYEESTGVTLVELREAQGAVTHRLLGPLLRSPDSEEAFAKALADEE
ncbi:hypothetical protein [Streptomyces sp. NPDC018711]|uniref:hypothetical protein n=1 Tax=Streptomyces sp. NPDC018711 TaxID=3365052 RepID=UPI003798AB4E